jgi:phage tail sheath protein FI
VDIFNLMIIPGDVDVLQSTYDAIWGPASTYCQQRRAFLLIDPPPTWTVNGRPQVVQDTTLINSLRSLVVKENSAVFYPRLRYTAGGPVRTVAPAGAVAGVMARIDSSRGIWKAPAGIEADIRGIVGLEVKLTDLENGVLNKQGANVLRVFPSGFTVWGARTLFGSDDLGSEWKYIPIRRFALFLEESLFRGTKWVVFEPNDEPLWAQIRLNLNAFMMGLFRQGAFQGSTPKAAFYVKCDAETTTQADRNLGIVNIEVGFAPLKPAEFVIIKIQQIAGEL